RGGGRGGFRGRGPAGDASPSPLPGSQPAFGDELAVGIGHGVAGNTQVRGQGTGGRELQAWAQPSGAHGVAERSFERLPDPGTGQVEMKIDRGTGPRFCHVIGPYHWVNLLLRSCLAGPYGPA